MNEAQINQHVDKYVRSLGRLLSKANAASGPDRLGFLYVASCRLAQLGQLAESQGFVPPVIAMELALNYGRQLKADGYGEIVIRTLTGRVTIVTHGPDGWSERLETARRPPDKQKAPASWAWGSSFAIASNSPGTPRLPLLLRDVCQRGKAQTTGFSMIMWLKCYAK